MSREHGAREARKQKTRRALLDAALRRLAGERSFASLSLREVARGAGLVPTAFYRHFRSLDELGLALVDESFRTLRQLMRAARSGPLPTKQLIRRSVETFVEHVRAHREHFQFVVVERAGGSPVLRNAIRVEIRLFVSELATDLGRFPALVRWRSEDLQMMAGLIVNLMVTAVLDVLDGNASAPEDERELVRTLEKQLRLVVLGASLWRSREP